LITASLICLTAGKSNKKKESIKSFLLFLWDYTRTRFSNYLKRSLAAATSYILPLEFAVGIEAAANYCSFIVLIISYAVQTVLGSLKGIGPLVMPFIIV
jgi:hypothetical protein